MSHVKTPVPSPCAEDLWRERAAVARVERQHVTSFGNNTEEAGGTKWHRLRNQGWHLYLNLKSNFTLMVYICNSRIWEVEA